MYNVFVQKRFKKKNRHDTELIAQGALNTQVQVKTCPTWRNIMQICMVETWWAASVFINIHAGFFHYLFF